MALPEKDHFLLSETAARWDVELHDLFYYAEHGLLEVQTWLDSDVTQICGLKKADDDAIPARIGLTEYKGYAVVEVSKLRKIIHYAGQSQISVNDLVVSREERDRFEKTYDLGCCCERAARAARCDPEIEKPISFAGRPSVMRAVVKHFHERGKKKLLERSLQRESYYLSSWAEKNIPDAQIPRPKTIQNVIRAEYRQFASTPEII